MSRPNRYNLDDVDLGQSQKLKISKGHIDYFLNNPLAKPIAQNITDNRQRFLDELDLTTEPSIPQFNLESSR